MYTDSIAKRVNYMLDRYRIKDLEGALVLDIGAHVGEFTLAAAKTAAKVISFEPDPVVREALIENTNGMINVEILPIALSNTTGKSDFYISTEHADSSLFIPEDYTRVIEIETFRLNDLNLDASKYTKVILKMDAEGFEPEVIDGGLEWIGKNLHIASIDVAPERAGSDTYKEVKQKLESVGMYQLDYTQDQVLIMGRGQ
jgi:FkbM family methyltransferase